MRLGLRTLFGFGWAFGGFIVERLLGLLVLVVLARALAPDRFAVIAGTVLIATLIDTMRDLGLREAIIQSSADPDETANTGLLMIGAVGLVQAAALFVAAPLGTHLVSDPAIVDMLRLMALVFPITALGIVPDAIMTRKLQFRQKAYGDAAGSVAKAAAVCALLELGFGIWSFPIAFIIGAAVRTLSRWLLCGWRPRLHFAVARARALLEFGMHVMIVGLLDPLLRQSDQVAVAVLLGDRIFALYTMAWRLPEIVITSTVTVLGNVFYPAFVELNTDREALVEAWLRSTRLSMIVLAPAAAGLAAISSDVLVLLFGEEWSAAAPIQQILCIGLVSIAAAWLTGSVFKACGRPDWITKLTLLEAFYFVPAVWLAAWSTGSALAAAGALAAAQFLSSAIRIVVACRHLDTPLWRFGAALAGPVAATGIMIVAVLAFRTVAAGWPVAAITAGSIATGIAAYAPTILLLERREAMKVADMLRASLGARTVGPLPAAAGPTSRGTGDAA